MATSVNPIFPSRHHWYDVSLRDVLNGEGKNGRTLVDRLVELVTATLAGGWWIYVWTDQVN